MNQPANIPHVLIVEDEPILLKFLTYHVQQAGYRATAIGMGSQIFPTLQADPADLILMDLGLPDGDGLSWTQQIKDTTHTPIVILTGRQGEDDRIMALGLGADDYLTKPCDPRELLLRMRNILERTDRTPATASAPSLAPGSTAPSQPSSPTTQSTSAERRGNERRDRREHRVDRRQTDRRNRESASKLPSVAVLGLGAVLLFGAGAGLTWFLLAPQTQPATQAAKADDDASVRPQGLRPPPQTRVEAPSRSGSKNTTQQSASTDRAPPREVTPATVPSLDQPVTARTAPPTETVETDDTSRSNLANLEVEGDRRIAATSYSWVLKAKCPTIPEVPWWRVRSHTQIVRYVNTRHAGDWAPYLKSWSGRLAKLRDIYERQSGIRTKTGETLKGDSLQTYIDQTAQRIAAVKCLSKAAADYEYKRTQLRN